MSYLLILIIKNIDKKKIILNILTNINSTEYDENYENTGTDKFTIDYSGNNGTNSTKATTILAIVNF